MASVVVYSKDRKGEFASVEEFDNYLKDMEREVMGIRLIDQTIVFYYIFGDDCTIEAGEDQERAEEVYRDHKEFVDTKNKYIK